MAQHVGYEGGNFTVTNQAYQQAYVGEISASESIAGAAESSQVLEIPFPPDAVIDRAVFEITAAPGGLVKLGSIAQVRQGEDNTTVIADFGGMVTVRNVSASQTELARWNGVEFVDSEEPVGEIQTERLRLTYDGTVDPVSVATSGVATLGAIPNSLELLVDGTTVWFERQGDSAGLTPPTVAGGVGFAVDRTEAIVQAFESTGGPVRVEFRSQTPGQLTLNADIVDHRVHPVAFPDGPARTLTLAEEGPITIDLPLPPWSDAWDIIDVTFRSSATVASHRVLPAEGPAASSDARIKLVPERMVLGRLPPDLRDRTSDISGIRVAVRGGTEGGDLAGRLLTDEDGRPGTPVDGGEFTPVSIAAGDSIRWATLTGAAAVGPDAQWVEFGPSFGTLDWVLTANPPTDPAAPGTDVYFRKPGGAVRSLPELAEVGQLRGSMRLIGEPDDDRPIGALSIGFDDEPGSRVELSPASDGTAVRLVPTGSLHPTSAAVTLSGIASVAGAYTFSDIRVSYREESS